jgi:hypothetical protein
MPAARSAGVQSANAFATGAWSPRLPISSLPNPMNTLMDTPMVCEGRSWHKRPLTRKWYVKNPTTGIMLIAAGLSTFMRLNPDTLLTKTFAVTAAASGVFLLFGLFTPLGGVRGALCSAAAALLTIPIDRLDALQLAVAAAVVGVTAAALGVLGPGAFSIDCRLFGRRKIIIPQIPRPQ